MIKYSDYKCHYCEKKLIDGIYVTLNDETHENTIRFCFSCQLNNFGLSFSKTKASAFNCYYCDISLVREDLLEDRKKYKIFTDVSTSNQIVFCLKCFKENAPNV